MNTQDTSTEIALLLPTQLSPTALCLSSSFYCYFYHTCPVTSRMIGIPTKAEKPDQMDVWWDVLPTKRLDHPTNSSESSDKTSTVSHCTRTPSTAITPRQPKRPSHQNDGIPLPDNLKQRSYYDEPIFRPQPRNTNPPPLPPARLTPRNQPKSQSASHQTPKIHLRIPTQGADLPYLFNIPIPNLFGADLRDLRSPPFTLTQLYTNINKEIINDFWSLLEHEP